MDKKSQQYRLPIKQHFVPQFYLRKFSCENVHNKKNYAIFVIDKKNNKKFKNNISQIAEEKNYYTVTFNKNTLTQTGQEIFQAENFCVYENHGKITVSIENWLGTLETRIAPTYKKALLIPSHFDDFDKKNMSILVSLFWLRTPTGEKKFNTLIKSESLKKRKQKLKTYFKIYPGDSVIIKLLWMQTFVSLINEEACHFTSRPWKFLKTDLIGARFITSDNPVQFYHDSYFGPIGSMTPKGQTILPLSPYIALDIFNEVMAEPITVELIDNKNVEKFNMLQEKNALRYIYTNN